MARGKPSAAQLDLSLPMLDILSSKSDMRAEDGTDIRNYGVGAGLPSAQAHGRPARRDEPIST